MATFTGSVVKTNYEQYYNEVRSNPAEFVKRVFGQNAAQPSPSGTFTIGESTFKLRLATKGKTRQLCIERQFGSDEPWIRVRMKKLMDGLFFRSSTRTMERALHSGSTIKTGFSTSLRKHVDRIVGELWPDIQAPNADAGPGSSNRRGSAVPARPRTISERSIGTMASLNPGDIDAWMRCPEGGPVGLKHIDRSKTRIEDDILVLSFKRGEEAIEFRLQARPGATQDHKERVQRDMERLLRIAKGKRDGCDYRNMAELMGRFMVATIEDEAPRLMEGGIHAIVNGQGDDAKPLLICTLNRDRSPELTRATRRAVARAIDDAMASCRASAAQRFQAVLNDLCSDKRDPVVATVLDVREELIEEIQQRAKPFLAQRRLAAFVRQVVLDRGVSAGAAQQLHGDLSSGASLPMGVRLVRFTRKPGVLDWLSGEAAHEEVLAVASRQDGDALRFVPQGRHDIAKWAWKTIKLAKVPKNVETDAKALHQTVFDSSMGEFFNTEIEPLLRQKCEALCQKLQFDGPQEQNAAEKLLLLLAGNLRIGNTTWGYLYRWRDEVRVGPEQPRHHVRGEGIEHDGVTSPMVADEQVSPQQAAAYALRQELENALPSLANVTPPDCRKPVTVYTEGKFESLHPFAEGNQSLQWRPIGQSQGQNQQSGPSPSSSSSTEPPSAPPQLRDQHKQQAEAKQRAEEETRRAEEMQRAQQKQQAEEMQRAEEEKRQAEAKRAEGERRQAEAKQQGEEEKRQAGEMQRAQQKPVEQKPAEQKPAEQKSAEQKSAEATEDKVPS